MAQSHQRLRPPSRLDSIRNLTFQLDKYCIRLGYFAPLQYCSPVLPLRCVVAACSSVAFLKTLNIQIHNETSPPPELHPHLHLIDSNSQTVVARPIRPRRVPHASHLNARKRQYLHNLELKPLLLRLQWPTTIQRHDKPDPHSFGLRAALQCICETSEEQRAAIDCVASSDHAACHECALCADWMADVF